jgi:hypothetical protein
MSVLVEGCAVVSTGDGENEIYYSPAVIEIKAGIQHSVKAVNGRIVWLCIHKTDCIDEAKVDTVLIQKSANMIDTGLVVDVDELNQEIELNPLLWNQHTLRTESVDSPHHSCDDIWVRFNAIENFDANNPALFHGEHESVWYIDSGVSKLVANIMKEVVYHAVGTSPDIEIGGILITRIPAGGKVLRHSDIGRWHAEYYKDKYLIPLVCDDKQAFCYDGESHITEMGHVYAFNNLIDHWVNNDSDKERVSLIICTRHK